MRGTVKDIVVVVAVSFAIPLVVFGFVCLFAWWLFTGVFLETDAEMMEIPKPPLVFSQYKRQAYYSGYLCGYDEDMAYNEYYYWNDVSFANQPNYQPITQENISEILAFVQDYEKQLDTIKNRVDKDADRLCRKYRYRTDSLSSDDYYRVDVWDGERPFTNYKLYIFDYETNRLYYLYYREV